MSNLPIYNCHIHTFTIRHVPRYFLRLQFGFFFGTLASLMMRWKPVGQLFVWIRSHSSLFSGNDIFDRYIRFLAHGSSVSQAEVLKGIQKQYPLDTTFVVLPMDMAFMNLGPVEESIDQQHEQLLELARQSNGRVIPFYAVDPRRDDIVNRVRANIAPDRFRGVKIYPNLGYKPDEENLMQVYELCETQGVPVMTHCSPGGLWKYGLDPQARLEFGQPGNYEKILGRFPQLKLCLAHFGGQEEWIKHLKSEASRSGPDRAWIKWITDMIRTGSYPNLYTDISYLAFQPKLKGLYFDVFDYLKVLLADQQIREHVLFGSDYYVVEREALTEKEASIALRSRLGEDLYFQIAYHNPRKYLG